MTNPSDSNSEFAEEVEDIVREEDRRQSNGKIPEDRNSDLRTPEDGIRIFNLTEDVPEEINIPDRGIETDEPNPEEYGDWEDYIYDLMIWEIGPEADSHVTGEDGSIKADPGLYLEGEIAAIDLLGERKVEVRYQFHDQILEDTEYPIKNKDELPEAIASLDGSIELEYNADNPRELRRNTISLANEIEQMDRALSGREEYN